MKKDNLPKQKPSCSGGCVEVLNFLNGKFTHSTVLVATEGVRTLNIIDFLQFKIFYFVTIFIYLWASTPTRDSPKERVMNTPPSMAENA